MKGGEADLRTCFFCYCLTHWLQDYEQRHTRTNFNEQLIIKKLKNENIDRFYLLFKKTTI